jgi:glycosyltransferase involved in cell wall biosynthesis
VFALHIDTAKTWRGGQQQVLLTVLGLRARGHRAVLVAHPEGELFRRASEGPDLVPLAPVNEIDLATAWKLSKMLRRWQPAIVHAHDPHAVSMAALGLSFRAPEPRPTLIASRRVDFHLQSHTFSQWKYRQVDGFIAASRAIRDVLVHDGIPSGRIEVVHDGIDLEKIQNRPAIDVHAEYWLPHGVPVVVNVGALVGHKGQRYLIDAMPLVLREVPDAHLIIFGEGELRPALERQVKHLSLGKRVLLPGFREDVLSLMKSADLFVMSSVTEGLGSAVLDAMAMGLAVVGTTAGGIPEVVVPGVTGELIEPSEPKSLAAMMVKLLKDPSLRRVYGDAGRQHVAANFGVERLVEGTLQCYRRFGVRPRKSPSNAES